MYLVKIRFVFLLSIMLAGCVAGINGSTSVSGWKGRDINEFVSNMEESGYKCQRSQHKAINVKDSKLYGRASCLRNTISPVCP